MSTKGKKVDNHVRKYRITFLLKFIIDIYEGTCRDWCLVVLDRHTKKVQKEGCLDEK